MTVTGRILRVPLEMPSSVTELIPRTPRIDRFDPWTVPGSQVLAYGWGLSDQTIGVPAGETWPEELGGVRLRTPTLGLRLGMVSPTAIRTQIPFDAPVILEDLAVTSESPFQQHYTVPWKGGAGVIPDSFLSETGFLGWNQFAVYRDTNPRDLIVGPVSAKSGSTGL